MTAEEPTGGQVLTALIQTARKAAFYEAALIVRREAYKFAPKAGKEQTPAEAIRRVGDRMADCMEMRAYSEMGQP